jgi:ketosteroid isomerase-like protein
VSFLALFVLFVIYGTFACQKKAGIDLTSARKALEEANQKFMDASIRGDAATVAALYTDNTLLLPPNSPMIQGKKATEEYWRETWAQLKIADFKMTILDLYGKGDLVCEVGSYTLKFRVQGKDAVDEGKYLVVWRQMADKTWKKHIDIWNSDRPTQ